MNRPRQQGNAQRILGQPVLKQRNVRQMPRQSVPETSRHTPPVLTHEQLDAEMEEYMKDQRTVSQPAPTDDTELAIELEDIYGGLEY